MKRVENINTDNNCSQNFDPYNKSLFNVLNCINKMSPVICDWLICESENYVIKNKNGKWTNERHKSYPTHDIAINVLPESVVRFILRYFTFNIGSQLLDVYHINKDLYKLDIDDSFIVKYDMQTQQTLEQHQDGSDMSVIVSLSNELNYTGGGTKFENGFIVNQQQGDIIMFPSKYKHEGMSITSGTRFLLVFFINVVNKY